MSPVSQTKRSSRREVEKALDDDNYEWLARIARQPGGYGAYDVNLRVRIWQCLLGVAPQFTHEQWRNLADDYIGDQDVIVADIKRNANYWDVHTDISPSARKKIRNDLRLIVRGILLKHPTLMYYQGFTEIALVFQTLADATDAFFLTERFALFHLSDYMVAEFQNALLPLCDSMLTILERVDQPVCQVLIDAGNVTHFCVPWLLTYFSHSVKKFKLVARIFDIILSHHPAMVVYMCAAIVSMQREKLLAIEPDICEIHTLVSGINFDEATVERMIQLAIEFAEQYPCRDFVRCLRLPVNSPLTNYPFPWVKRKEPMEKPLAPIYRPGISKALMACSWRSTSMVSIMAALGFSLVLSLAGPKETSWASWFPWTNLSF